LTQLPLNQTPDLLKQGSLPPLLSPSRQSFLVKPSHRDIVELAKLIVSLPVKINFLSKVMNLPLFSETRKTLIIDLDETLTHTVKKDESSQVTLEIKEAEKISINVRPFVIEFLKFASNEFEVVVFTASKQKYADTILDYLDPTGKLIHYRLYREQCYCFNGNFIKDIRILGGRDMRNVIIVDNTLNSFALQVENGIPITTWTSDPKDQQLKLLIDYLKILKIARDVRTVNRNTFGISNLVNGEIILSRNQNVTLSN
jgi:CTD small phosphatase-like protein 2